MTPIFKKANVSLEGEESKYDFMRFTAKNLGQLHITTSNMPTPPTSGTSGFVKRHADQKVQKTRKKRKVEKVRNLSSIQKEKEDGSPKDADDQAHYPPAMKLFSQVVELARKIVQNVVDEEQFQKEDEVVQERNVQNEAMMVASVTEDDAQKVKDASLQKEAENVEKTCEKLHQKVDEVLPQIVAQRVDEDTQEVAEILASKMMSGEDVQDEHMEFSTGYDLNIEDLNSDFNNDRFQDGQETVQIVQERSEIEDHNVLVVADQNVQTADQNIQENASNEPIFYQGQLSADPNHITL